MHSTVSEADSFPHRGRPFVRAESGFTRSGTGVFSPVDGNVALEDLADDWCALHPHLSASDRLEAGWMGRSMSDVSTARGDGGAA
jgi:hypothetical protein